MKKLVFTGLLVVFAACGRHTGGGSSPAAGSASAGRSTITAADSAVTPATNAIAASTADPELPVVDIEAAFASADEAVKRSCARALAAYQIGDYHGAVQEFESFADKSDLTAEQNQLAHDALETARRMAAITEDPRATPQPPPTDSTPGTGNEASAPALPDPALQESIARAEIASRIGDYPKALAELTDIADSPRLTAEQRRTVQRLLAETRKNFPQDPNNAARPPVKKW
jgi:hypothetical protein